MPLRILIVDDSPSMRSFIRRVISLSGLEVSAHLEAGDGQEAMDLLDREHVDVILTDINMPRMNGEEFVRQLSESGMLKSVPVLVISTDATVVRREHLTALGARGYLTKPFLPETLREEIERVMGVPDVGESMSAALGSAVETVLETMFFTMPEGEVNLEEQALPVHHRVGMTFSGAYWGCFELRITPDSARAMAGSFTGAMHPEELPDDKVLEVVAELTNMICGSTLSHWASDKIFSLGTPRWISTADMPVDTSVHQHPEDNPNKLAAAFYGRRAFDLGNGLLAAEIEVHEGAA